MSVVSLSFNFALSALGVEKGYIRPGPLAQAVTFRALGAPVHGDSLMPSAGERYKSDRLPRLDW
jgi:hypothetical protein